MDDPGTSGMLGREMDLHPPLPFPVLVAAVARVACVDNSGSPR